MDFDRVQQAAEWLRGRTTGVPDVAIVLGSGLGDFASSLTDATTIDYGDIPHWPASKVIGHAGRLVIPNDHRGPLGGGDAKYSHAFFSDDHGASWKLGGTVAPHTDECQVVELSDGTLMMNMRNYWQRDGGDASKGGKRAIATSGDGGETWSELSFDETLTEPVCQASFTRYSGPDGATKSRLLFSNPASTEARVKMTVRLSYDEGNTWPVARLLHEGPAAYSCLGVLPDHQIGCLYERGTEHSYETISFARFTLRWLSGGKDSTGA